MKSERLLLEQLLKDYSGGLDPSLTNLLANQGGSPQTAVYD